MNKHPAVTPEHWLSERDKTLYRYTQARTCDADLAEEAVLEAAAGGTEVA